jgi:glycosyltransferase involved in cell wall biosynthesis
MSVDNQTPNILVLIPAYNEGHRVAGVIKKAEQFLPVLVIDDGSTDDTATHAENAGAELLRQVPNQGKGAALIAGFRKAIELGYEAVIMLDADGQHDADEIPKFLAAYQVDHADLVIGQREFKYMPRLRRTTNTLGTWMFSWAMGQHIADNQSGYRLLSRRMMEAMLESNETNFEFEVEMIVQCVLHKYRLAWVPIRTIYGDEKSHIRPVRHAYHFFRMVFQTRRATRAVRRGG